MSNGNGTKGRRESHFWITATVIALHTFLISDQLSDQFKTDHWAGILTVAIATWFMASYLIVEIGSEVDVKRPVTHHPAVAGGDTGYGTEPFWRKWWETVAFCRAFYRGLWFILLEFKGAFFFFLLVFFSFTGVCAANGAFWLPTVLLAIMILLSLLLDGAFCLFGNWPWPHPPDQHETDQQPTPGTNQATKQN